MRKKFKLPKLHIKRETLRELNPSQLGHALGGTLGGCNTCTSGTTDVSNDCCEPCCETITCQTPGC